MIELKLTPVSDYAIYPTYGTDQAACFDLCADLRGRKIAYKYNGLGTSHQADKDITHISLDGYNRMLIPTGFIFHIPDGYQMKINPRSGLAWKNGITILNAPATIDSDYEDETFVVLYNTSSEPFIIEHGMRIAQAELVKVNRVNLDSGGKRQGGFGSTGV